LVIVGLWLPIQIVGIFKQTSSIIPKRKNIRTLRGTTSDWKTFEEGNKDAIAEMIQKYCKENREKE
jgi:hypothetical protein